MIIQNTGAQKISFATIKPQVSRCSPLLLKKITTGRFERFEWSSREMKRKIVLAVPTDDDSERDDREMKRKIDSADGVSGKVQVPDHVRAARGNELYFQRMDGASCCWIGDDPPMVEGDDVGVGTSFLKKTITITPDSFLATLIWSGVDDTQILLRGKDSVCAVAHDKVRDSSLQACIIGSSAAFFFWEKLEEHEEDALCFSEDEDLRPFADVILSLDTAKDDWSESRIHNLDDYRHKDFGARYNEKIAISFLEDKMKQVPFIDHEETVKAAIKAFKILLGEDFKGDEMKVYVVARDFSTDRALSAEEIKGHLDVIRD